jgi:hypothetical protein
VIDGRIAPDFVIERRPGRAAIGALIASLAVSASGVGLLVWLVDEVIVGSPPAWLRTGLRGLLNDLPAVAHAALPITAVICIVLAVLLPWHVLYLLRRRYGRCEVVGDVLLLSPAFRLPFFDRRYDVLVSSEVEEAHETPHGVLLRARGLGRLLRISRPLFVPARGDERARILDLVRSASPPGSTPTLALRRGGRDVYELVNGGFLLAVLSLAPWTVPWVRDDLLVPLFGLVMGVFSALYTLLWLELRVYDEPTVVDDRALYGPDGPVAHASLARVGGAPPLLAWEDAAGRRGWSWAGPALETALERISPGLRAGTPEGAPGWALPPRRRRRLAGCAGLVALAYLGWVFAFGPWHPWETSQAFHDQEGQSLRVLRGVLNDEVHLVALAVGPVGQDPPGVAVVSGWGPWRRRHGPADAALVVDRSRRVIEASGQVVPLQPDARFVILTAQGEIEQSARLTDEEVVLFGVMARLYEVLGKGETDSVLHLVGLLVTDEGEDRDAVLRDALEGRTTRAVLSAEDPRGDRFLAGVDGGEVRFVAFVGGGVDRVELRLGGFQCRVGPRRGARLVTGGAWASVPATGPTRVLDAPTPDLDLILSALARVKDGQASVAAVVSELAPPNLGPP